MPVTDEVLKMFEGLRVADVSDGMDAANVRDVGLVDRAIRPVWRGGRAYGRAVTARYVATSVHVPHMTPEEYAAYSSEWYAKRCPYPYMQELKPGDFLVIDMSGLEVGLWGSNVGLAAVKAGVSGVVLDGGCRDTAEIERQRCKVWCRHIARTTVIGRLEFAGMNEIVNIGGVKVSPGDVVVADDDGVIVVPAEAAELVARVARRELEADKKARRQLYQELGMPFDETVSD